MCLVPASIPTGKVLLVRKGASYSPAFDTLSTTRKASLLVSGMALTKLIAAYGGIGPVKVPPRLAATTRSASRDQAPPAKPNRLLVRSPAWGKQWQTQLHAEPAHR